MLPIGATIFPVYGIVLGWLTGPLLSLLALLLIGTVVYIAVRRLGWKRLLMWLEFAYLIRFQLIGAILLALVLPAGYFAAPSIFLGLFDAVGSLSFGFVVYASLQLAFTIMIAWRLTRVYGPERFEGICELPPVRRPSWKSTGLFALLAFPSVGMMCWGTDISWWKKVIGIAAAAVLSLAVLWLTAKLHVYLEDEGGETAGYVFPPWDFLKYIPGTRRSGPGKVVDQVLKSLLPERLRPGILKTSPDGVTLRSGHQLAGLTLLVQFVLYVAIGFFTSPRVTDREPAAIFYVLFLLALFTWLFAGAAFFLDAIRIPVLTACLTVSLLFGFIKTDHIFEVENKEVNAEPLAPIQVIEAWEHTRTNGDTKAPIVIVATAGGGIRAAAWTAEALTGLTESCREMPDGHSFVSSLVLVSAVSGGSVGAMYVVGAYDQGSLPRDLGGMRTMAGRSSLSAVGWGFLYPDLVRIIPGFGSAITPVLGESVDRGWALEREWVNHWVGYTLMTQPTIRSWSSDVQQGIRPAVIFNATASETGQRFLTGSTMLPPDPDPGSDYQPSIQFSDHFQAFDLPVATAVRLSATFPWVSPMPRASAGDPRYRVHVGDGGYYDNSGILSAVEWLVAAKDAIQQHPVYLVIIDSTAELSAYGQSWTWQRQIVAPMGSLLSVRTSSQSMRAQYELKLATELLTKLGLQVAQIHLRYPAEKSSPLSWHMTSSQEARIHQAWSDPTNLYLNAQKKQLFTGLGCASPDKH